MYPGNRAEDGNASRRRNHREAVALIHGVRERACRQHGFAQIGGREEEDGSYVGAIGGINVNAKSTKRLRARAAQPK